MPKKTTEILLLPLFNKYVREIKSGKHLQKNGRKIKAGSLVNYYCLQKLLSDFSVLKNYQLRIKPMDRVKKSEFNAEQKYWKDFYIKFTNYLYFDLDHYDNYVGRVMKLLRAFFNYLNSEKGINTGLFYKKFYSPSEEIEIIALSPERLNFLIFNKEIESKLSDCERKVKDIFVFGCSVALRYSDLMTLSHSNIEVINDRVYLNVQSKKTQTFTRVKLPQYAIEIYHKYKKDSRKRLLPYYNKAFLNIKIKKVMEISGFTEPVNRCRSKKGIPQAVLRGVYKAPYRFCDCVTTHTMRRTGITVMLSLGMNEIMVRKISGHSAGSKEFYRYVSFAQAYMDNEIDMVHEKFVKKTLKMP